jgi:DNA repair exonuclease SbcCD ATPase subunit
MNDKHFVTDTQIPPRDIAFDCPLCKGHLVAQSSQIGSSAECPHCNRLLFIPKARYVSDETELPGVRRILKRTKARISQPKPSAPRTAEVPVSTGPVDSKAEEERSLSGIAAVEAELKRERGSAAALVQLQAEIAIEREDAKKMRQHAAELEANLNRHQEIGIAAIAGLETRIEDLQKQLDRAILEVRSLSHELEQEREAGRRDRSELEELREKLTQKSEATQRAQARCAELETELERSSKDSSSKITDLESGIADLHRQLNQISQTEQSRAQQDEKLTSALGQLQSGALEVLKQLSHRQTAPPKQANKELP